MNQKATMYLSKLVEYIKNLDKKRRITYIAILAVVVVTTVIIAVLLNLKHYVVLYRNLDVEECYTIAGKLDEMSVPYKVENDSTIYVDEKDEPSVKIQLATEGFPKSALNYDIFTENIDFMTTDYEKTKYSLFLVQERLQATIKTLDGVEDAIVSITVPDNSYAVLEEDKISPSSSVVLKLKNNVTLSKKQIKGIELLVARSVPGLLQENVSIVDQTGAIINDYSEDSSLVSTAEKIKTENEMANIISNRIVSVLEPIYGRDKLSVGVNVVLDYSKKAIDKTEYVPGENNTGVIDNFDQEYEGPGNIPQNGGIPGTEPNTEIPGYHIPADTDNNENIKNKVSVDYLVSQIREQIQKDGAEIKDLTVSVLIDKKDISETEADKITGIVANTSGVSKEKVEIFYTDFAGGNADEEPSQDGDLPTFFADPFAPQYLIIYGLITLILAVAIIIIILKAKQKRKKELVKKLLSEEELMAKVKETDIKLSESEQNHYIKDIREFAVKNPQVTALLLRSMLQGGQGHNDN